MEPPVVCRCRLERRRHLPALLVCVLLVACGAAPAATRTPAARTSTSSTAGSAVTSAAATAARPSTPATPGAAVATRPNGTATRAATAGLAAAAAAYLAAALDLMERDALYSPRVDWPTVRREAARLAGTATTPGETYPALRWALYQLGDRHSRLLTPLEVQQARAASPPSDPAAGPQARRLAEGVGYLALPAVAGGQAVGEDYTARGAAALREGGVPPCGWVVDLRGNTGGNMWPMLAVAGPLLGEGDAGAFITARGVRAAWGYRAGQALLAGTILAWLPPPVPPPQPGPVAVLTDRRTASAGEAIVLAFRGRPEARSFGEATYGVPTANQSYPLADGAGLVLTVARMADRTGHAYEDPLVPDEPVVGGGTAGDPATDVVLRAALTWLRGHPGCGG